MTSDSTNNPSQRTRKRQPELEFPPIFRGRHEKAVYRDPIIEFFRGNPCIEALPEDISDQQLARLLTHHIPVTIAQRRLAAHHRDHYIEHIPRFYHPLAKAYQVHRQLQRMIRGGYVGIGRNPAELTFWDDIEQLAQSMKRDEVEGSSNPSEESMFQELSAYAGATAGSLIGVSGMGKSRTLKEILLKLFPQVIYHEAYGNRALPFQQVVWLFLECPNNASIKALLLQFFWALDAILNTPYYNSITRNGSMSADNLIIPMAKLALAHAIGLLVIDETQNVNQAASGGDQRILNLFVKLINWVGIPVLLIGTPEAMTPLTAKFRMARRMSGQGDPKWGRMQRDDVDWDMFVEALWTHQYLRKTTPLTPDLKEALYSASTGITEVAVRTFMFAQRHAIARAARPSDEQLTPQLITSIPLSELGLMEPVLNALREGKEQGIERINDVKMETPSAIPDEDVGFAPPPARTQVQDHGAAQAPTLTNRLLVACAEQPAELSVYERLKRAGFTRPVTEFL